MSTSTFFSPNERQPSQVVIFAHKDRSKSFEILSKAVQQSPGRSLVWLIRESSSGPGMLTVDYMRRLPTSPEEGVKWRCDSVRYALIHRNEETDPARCEWVCANNMEDVKKMGTTIRLDQRKVVTNENLQNEVKSLFTQLQQETRVKESGTTSDIDSVGAPIQEEAPRAGMSVNLRFLEHRRLTPTLQFVASNSSPYAAYAVAARPTQQPTTALDDVPPQIKASITCSISNGIMEDPVTVTEGDLKGWAVERKIAEQNKLQFYPNLALKNIIESLQTFGMPRNKDEEEALTELTNDPITLTPPEHPSLAPSGITYEHDSIVHWIRATPSFPFPQNPNKSDPMTRTFLLENMLVPNINLQNFIEAYNAFKALKENHLFCIDFDETISQSHIHNLLAGRGLPDDDAGWQEAQKVQPTTSASAQGKTWKGEIERLTQAGHSVAIVSYSNYPNIVRRYLKEKVGLDDDTMSKIKIESGFPQGDMGIVGKSEHIERACRDFSIEFAKHQIVLIDDSGTNIRLAREAGHVGVQAQKGGNNNVDCISQAEKALLLAAEEAKRAEIAGRPGPSSRRM